jgi:hypothetical protein
MSKPPAGLSTGASPCEVRAAGHQDVVPNRACVWASYPFLKDFWCGGGQIWELLPFGIVTCDLDRFVK